MPFTVHDADFHRNPAGDGPLDPDGPEGYQSQDVPIPEPHCQAIGRFVAACCTIEKRFYYLVQGLLGLEPELSRAVFGQPSYSQLISRLTTILEIKSPEKLKSESGQYILSSVRYIMSVRNIVVHQDLAYRTGWIRYFKDNAKDFSYPNNLIYPIKLVELDNLSKFAGWVQIALGFFSGSQQELDEWSRRSKEFFDNNDLPEPPEKRVNRLKA
ncbi:hypothetical protein [Sphingomonas sp. PAMC 26621]|uniref:hypothetical protein n=1 Tax=Sphingomonas sp. PAMC 26621 TaxID=1112213 RepID=UPI0011113B20|nr:hypothetical protein [Sphingomonas sp. PAMC 26621]